MLIRIGSQSIDAGRYVRMARDAADGEPRLRVYLDAPRQIVTVTGYDDVTAAVEEVRTVLAELERERLGGGWVTFGGDDDD